MTGRDARQVSSLVWEPGPAHAVSPLQLLPGPTEPPAVQGPTKGSSNTKRAGEGPSKGTYRHLPSLPLAPLSLPGKWALVPRQLQPPEVQAVPNTPPTAPEVSPPPPTHGQRLPRSHERQRASGTFFSPIRECAHLPAGAVGSAGRAGGGGVLHPHQQGGPGHPSSSPSLTPVRRSVQSSCCQCRMGRKDLQEMQLSGEARSYGRCRMGWAGWGPGRGWDPHTLSFLFPHVAATARPSQTPSLPKLPVRAQPPTAGPEPRYCLSHYPRLEAVPVSPSHRQPSCLF